MLSINASLKSSPIHGIGIFTDEPIRHNQPIATFVEGFDGRWTREQLIALPRTAKEYIWYFGWWSIDDHRYYLDGDNMRFINHSNKPNCYINGFFDLCARRPIEAGEELTFNYLSYFNASHPENELTNIYHAYRLNSNFYEALLKGKHP